MLKSAFISYSTDASTKAKQVSGYLEPLGVDTFVFEKNLSKNKTGISKRIKDHIEKRDAIIMILSVESRESNWVSHELGIAFGVNKKIFIIKTAHNLLLPDYIDEYDVTILKQIEELDDYFESKYEAQLSIPKKFDNKRSKKMATRKRAFISFDIDHDEGAKIMLAGQAKLPDSPFDFKDNSVKEHLSGDWKDKVRRRMDNVDVVIVLCGTRTHTASGVAAEISIAKEKNKPYFLLSAYSDKHCTKPTTASASDKVYKWTWDNLKSLISGNR